MKLSVEILETIVGGRSTTERTSNINSILAGLETYGYAIGLNTASRLAIYVSQLAHESGRFIYDREVWGPTPAQKRYEGRKDLGNTEAGDGSKFRGHTPMQITGRENTTAFRDWCRAQGLPAPDFVENPELMNTDPWEGLGPIWYWQTRNLNRYADQGNIEMVTRKINGGTNGLDDRINLYVRSALVLLGYKLDAGAVKRFQEANGLIADDIPGPATRAALHAALVKLNGMPVTPIVDVIPIPTNTTQPTYTLQDYTAIIREALAGIERLNNEQA